MKNEKTAGRLRIVSGLLFMFYVAVLLYYMFFAEDFGRGEIQTEYHYNLVPFREIRRFFVYWQSVGFLWAAANILGNVICFLPFGTFLPLVLYKVKWNWFKVVCCGFFISLMVESMQLIFKIGVFDVDDLLLNTAGALVGYWVYRLGKGLIRKCHYKND